MIVITVFIALYSGSKSNRKSTYLHFLYHQIIYYEFVYFKSGPYRDAKTFNLNAEPDEIVTPPLFLQHLRQEVCTKKIYQKIN